MQEMTVLVCRILFRRRIALWRFPGCDHLCVRHERCWDDCALMELRFPPVRTGGDRRGMWETCPSATLCTANHNLLAWVSALGLRGEKLANCCLSHVAAWRLR